MSEAIKMPPVVQAACDAVVAAILANEPPPDADLKVLQEWLEIDGWELIGDSQDEILLTDLRALSQYFEDDWVMSEFLDWSPDEEADLDNFKDDDRLKWAKYICEAVDQGKLSENECMLASAHPVPLTSTKGENAVIACVLLFQGQAGFEVEWHGTWKDRRAFDEYLSTVDRYCLLGQTAQLSDERILSMWSFPSVNQAFESTIIAKRESSSMASTWREYLCLTEGDEKDYKLFTGQYEALASIYDYYDEETGDYELPDEIDGVVVVEINDEYIVGGELSWCDASDTVEFDDVEDPMLVQWLTESGWSKQVSVEDVKKIIDSVS